MNKALQNVTSVFFIVSLITFIFIVAIRFNSNFTRVIKHVDCYFIF